MLIFVQKLILRKNRAFSFTFMEILFCSKTQHHSLIVLNRFSTEDRQIKWGRIIKPIYILCNQSNESRHHLDFACPYARLVWIIFYTSAKSTGLYWRVAAGIQLSKKDFQNKPFFQLVKHCLVCLSLFYLEGKTRCHEGKCSSDYSVWFYSFCCKCRLPGTPISNFAITRSLFVVIMTFFRSSLDWLWYYIF